MEEAIDVSALDWSLFGAMVRHSRIKAGYRTVDEFANAVFQASNMRIGRETIYKIESGKQIPNASQLIAICICAFNQPSIPCDLINLMDKGVS